MACQGSAKRACVEYDMPDYVTGYDLQQATRLAYEGDIEAVDAFLRSRPAFKSQLGAHILLRAAERGYVLLVAHLLTDEGVNRNYVALADGRNAFSAFLQAAQWGHAPVVTVLLADERVDPNKSWGLWDDGLDLGSDAWVRSGGDRPSGRRTRGPQHAQVWRYHGAHVSYVRWARPGGDAAAGRRAREPQHDRRGWQHGTHRCRAMAQAPGGEDATCR